MQGLALVRSAGIFLTSIALLTAPSSAQHLVSGGLTLGTPHAVNGLKLSYDLAGQQPCFGADILFGSKNREFDEFAMHLTALGLNVRWNFVLDKSSILLSPYVGVGTDLADTPTPLNRGYLLVGLQARGYIFGRMYLEHQFAASFSPGAQFGVLPFDPFASLSLGYTFHGLQSYPDGWRRKTNRNKFLFLAPPVLAGAVIALVAGFLYLVIAPNWD